MTQLLANQHPANDEDEDSIEESILKMLQLDTIQHSAQKDALAFGSKELTNSKFKKIFSQDTLQRYEKSNPEYFETYYLLGQYYLEHKQKEKGVTYLKKALTKQLPKIGFKTEIEELIKEHSSQKWF